MGIFVCYINFFIFFKMHSIESGLNSWLNNWFLESEIIIKIEIKFQMNSLYVHDWIEHEYIFNFVKYVGFDMH